MRNFLNPFSIINPFISSLKRQIYSVTAKGYMISFMWVKAHSGMTGNEKVDTLPTGGSRLEELDSVNIQGDSFSLTTGYIWTTDALWSQYWRRELLIMVAFTIFL